jgi:hypothetical protein
MPLRRQAQARVMERLGEDAWRALRGGLLGVTSSVQEATSSSG